MKRAFIYKYIFIWLFILCVVLLKAKAQSNIDTTFEILKRIDYASYERKPVDSLLQHLPTNFVSIKIRAHHTPYYATSLAVTYPNDVYLSIEVRNFQYLNPLWDYQIDQYPHWDLNLFKRENIAYSYLFRGPICYIGCDKAYQ